MSTGTKDFVDDAVDQLRKGDQAFALVAIDPTSDDAYLFSTRYGEHDAKDVERLIYVVENKLLPILRQTLKDYEQQH